MVILRRTLQKQVTTSKKFVTECKTKQEATDVCRLAGKYKEEMVQYWSAWWAAGSES